MFTENTPYSSWLYQCFKHAIYAVSPYQSLSGFLPNQLPQKIRVLAIGKGAAHWAKAFDDLCVQHSDWSTHHSLSAIIVTPYGQGNRAKADHFEIWEASHPLPCIHGLKAAQRLLVWAQNRSIDEHVFAIILGGGSALLPAPIPPLTLQDEIDLHQALLSCGAAIHEINTVRIQVSQIKGGGLAHALSTPHLTNYIVSDIPGDHIQWVSSGPTIPSKSTFAHAWDIINRYQLLSDAYQLSIRLKEWLHSQSAKPSHSKPSQAKPNQAFLLNIDPYHTLKSAPLSNIPVYEVQHKNYIVASAHVALHAVKSHIEAQNIRCVIIDEQLEGDAQVVGDYLAQCTKTYYANLTQNEKCVLLSGGEVTVSIEGKAEGQGGPNSELALAFAKSIVGFQGVFALFADTDGIDGYGGHAGAFVDAYTWQSIQAHHTNPAESLRTHASYEAFDSIKALLHTGFTGSNVNDLRVIMIDKSSTYSASHIMDDIN